MGKIGTFFRHLQAVIRFKQLPRSERHIVFYSEGKQYWPHLKGLVQELLKQNDIVISYVSSDPEDPALEINHHNLRQFEIGDGSIRNWFFANLEADIMVMTMPDLHHYQIKKSIHPVHYVYVQHSLVSLHMIYRKGAFDHYDTIFCAGPHHIKEMEAIQERHNLSPKNLVEHGYARLDDIIEQNGKASVENPPPAPVKKRVLLAPSWGPQGILETIGTEVVGLLIDNGYHVTVRPHPQTVKFASKQLDEIKKSFGQSELFLFDDCMNSQESLHLSDVMISDWSGAALDYALGLRKPVVFIDVPRKVNNQDYEELNIEPLEVSIRNDLGAIVHPDKLDELVEKIETTRLNVVEENVFFNPTKSDAIGANVLRDMLEDVAN